MLCAAVADRLLFYPIKKPSGNLCCSALTTAFILPEGFLFFDSVSDGADKDVVSPGQEGSKASTSAEVGMETEAPWRLTLMAAALLALSSASAMSIPLETEARK